MNVTVEDIRGITPGCAVSFKCESPNKLRSAQSLVAYCNKINRPQEVWKYITKSDWQELYITITALSINAIETDDTKKAI